MQLHMEGFITASYSGICTDQTLQDLLFDYFGYKVIECLLLSPLKAHPVSVSCYFISILSFFFFSPSKSETLG